MRGTPRPPEIKSADVAALNRQFAGLLADLQLEMRAQFEQFRLLRQSAERWLHGDDEAVAKLARADLKAASDAMALIVRTLEKIDELQRQLIRDADAEADLALSEGDRAALEAMLEQRITRQAETLAALIVAAQTAAPPGMPEPVAAVETVPSPTAMPP